MTSMRHFLNLVESTNVSEKYTSDNTYLLKHLQNTDFDPYSCRYEVCEWIERNDYLDLVSEVLGTEIGSADELQEEEPEVFYKLPEQAKKDCAEYVLNYIMRHDPASAPSSAHMSLNGDKLLPRSTWLVHFSDHASDIGYNGFQYGMDDMDRLGLTTYYTDAAKKDGGYNFAFKALSRYALDAASRGKYGRHAVIFQNSGVNVHHSGDEEDQVIFHGADVSPSTIIILVHSEGDWLVKPKLRLKSGRDHLYRGTYQDCVKWVQANIVQYRAALTGH